MKTKMSQRVSGNAMSAVVSPCVYFSLYSAAPSTLVIGAFIGAFEAFLTEEAYDYLPIKIRREVCRKVSQHLFPSQLHSHDVHA